MKIVCRRQENFVLQRCNKIDEFRLANKTADMQKFILLIDKEAHISSLNALKSRDDHVITEIYQILNRWKEYCAILTSAGRPTTRKSLALVFDVDLPPFRTEVEKALRELNKAKTPGFDDVPAKLLQADGDAAFDVLHRL